MGSVTLLAEIQHETICCTNVFPVSEWQYIGCSVLGSTMARSNIRAKSSLTSRGLCCRLAWRTVSVNQKKVLTGCSGYADRGARWEHKLKRQSSKAGCFKICSLSCIELYRCAPFVVIFHFTGLSQTDQSSQWMLPLLPSKHTPNCSQKSGPPEWLAAWARHLLSKITPSCCSLFSQNRAGPSHVVDYKILTTEPVSHKLRLLILKLSTACTNHNKS